MRVDCHWGDHVTLEAACKVYGQTVRIYPSGAQQVLELGPNPAMNVSRRGDIYHATPSEILYQPARN